MKNDDIKSLLRQEGFTFTRSLGQNFLFDERLLRSIVNESGITAGDTALEIGPGAGTLTRALADTARRVVAVEIDARLMPVLSRALAGYGNVTVVNADFLKLDLCGFTDEHRLDNFFIIANLPYYITTPILFRVFESGCGWRSITVMVQREVAERICAGPGGKTYGALSCMTRYYSVPKIVRRVPGGAFFPAPDVDSAVIRLDRLGVPPVGVADEKAFFRFIHSCFAMRRKTLLNNIAHAYGIGKNELANMFSEISLDPDTRAEALSLEELGRVYAACGELTQPGDRFADIPKE